MNHWLRNISLLSLVTLAMVACGGEAATTASDTGTGTDPGSSSDSASSSDPSSDSDGGTSLDGDWYLVAGTVDGAPLALSTDYRVTMSINGSEIGGQAGCNSYGGTVSIDGDSFSVGELSQTEMACEPDVTELEIAFLNGLSRVTSAVQADATATLAGDGVDYTFETVAPLPAADLIGSTWVLGTILTGDVASSVDFGADPATLTLAADGTVVGETGCRTFAGEYIISGDTVQLTSLKADGECPDELAGQDSQIISVLEAGFTAEVDGSSLTITAPGGEGLGYSAQG